MQKIALLFLTALMLFEAGTVSADPDQKQISPGLPFQPGEKLTYEISWSNILRAGKAVMEVKKEEVPGEKTAYRCTSTAKSEGLVSKFYKVSDTIASVIDSQNVYSLAFHLNQRHGKRIKQREMTFDREKGMVSVMTDGQQATYAIPQEVQDPLSSIYYVRSRPDKDFDPAKPIIVNVHEDGKTWAVEVQTIGREKIKTPLGDFNTIKIKTYPRYEGVFQNKGEIFIWLTDDARRIPVLMKSTITIGSIVSTLVEMETGEEKK